jgi:hypothetical protein
VPIDGVSGVSNVIAEPALVAIDPVAVCTSAVAESAGIAEPIVSAVDVTVCTVGASVAVAV